MNQPVTIHFTFTYRDVLVPGLNIYIKRPMFWLLMLLSALCIALSFLLLENYLTLRIIGIFGMVVPLSVFILLVIVKNRQLVNKEIGYSISEKGIELQLPDEKQFQEWSSVTRFIEEHKRFMLFCSTQRAHILPKRAFKNAEQMKEFLELISLKRPDLLKK